MNNSNATSSPPQTPTHPSKHSSLPSDVQMARESTESRRLSAELPKIDTSLDSNRRMSLDVNFKFPKPVGISHYRVLETIKAEESEAQALKDIEYERKINAVQEMIISPIPVSATLPYMYSSSKLNPENNYPSRLREEMRLSPLPQISSPITSKRKLSLTDEKDLIHFRPVKRIIRATSRPPHFTHTRTNSGSSVNSEMSIQMECGSPRVQGVALNLGGAGADFGKMKLS